MSWRSFGKSGGIKCRCRKEKRISVSVIFQLKAKNYNDLCLPSTTPIVLGLLILPENEQLWIHWTEEELLLRGCMYWAEFSKEAESVNEGTVSVKISKKNMLHAESRLEILERIAKEEWP